MSFGNWLMTWEEVDFGRFYLTNRMDKTYAYIILSFCLLLPPSIGAQVIPNGLYSNSEGEFVCIKDDSISFKLSNFDAFGSYSICLGTFQIHNKVIRIRSDTIEKLTSQFSLLSRNDDLIQINLLLNDGSPLIFSSVTIVYQYNDEYLVLNKVTDIKGVVLFNQEESFKLNGTFAQILITTIGFRTRQEVQFRNGMTYIIQSKIIDDLPVFIISNHYKLKVKSIPVKSNQLTIINKKNKSILLNCKVSSKCYDALFKTY